MARHAAPKKQRRTLMRAGLTVALAGAAVGCGAATAGAAPVPTGDLDAAAALTHATAGALGPAKNLKLHPLAQTGVDPLDNHVGTQVADFKPMTTKPLTAPITQGGSVNDLPVVNTVAGALPG